MSNKFISTLKGIRQSKVTYSRAGGGAGSVIMMEMNNEVYQYVLFVNCAWRIENKNQIIATSSDDTTANTGLIAKSVKLFEGKIIETIEMTPFYDLIINFTEGFCLKIFSIFSFTSNSNVNWSLCVPSQDISFDITNHFDVKEGKYYS